HVFRRGTLTVIGPGEASVTLAEPAALFFPRGSLHSFLPDPTTGAELVCATVDMGARQCNPITLGLPEVLVIPFAQSAFLAATCELLF
ncbi:cupin domain-containing protein, partial [Staphylococcus aureus]